MKKNIISLCLLTTLSFILMTQVSAKSSDSYYINNNNIKISLKEFQNLKSLGFTEEQIYYMDENEYNQNKDLNGHVVAIDTKYIKTTYRYKINNVNEINSKNVNDLNYDNLDNLTLFDVKNEEITEDEYNKITENTKTTYSTNDVNPDIIDEEYKKLTTQIIKISNSYRVRNDLLWKIMPKNRSYDVNGIALNSSVAEAVSGSQYSKMTYSLKDSCTLGVSNYTTDFSNTKYWKRGQGYLVTVKVPENGSKEYTWDQLAGVQYPCKDNLTFVPTRGTKKATLALNSLSTYMYFNLTKIGSGALSAYGSYQHSVKSIDLNTGLSFSLSPGGPLGGAFNVSATISEKFDGMPGTHAQILKPSW